MLCPAKKSIRLALKPSAHSKFSSQQKPRLNPLTSVSIICTIFVFNRKEPRPLCDMFELKYYLKRQKSLNFDPVHSNFSSRKTKIFFFCDKNSIVCARLKDLYLRKKHKSGKTYIGHFILISPFG